MHYRYLFAVVPFLLGFTGEDIQRQIDECGSGRRAGPCVIELPAGTIPVSETLVSGGETNADIQVGVQVYGQGQPEMQMRGGGHSAGTTLEWQGEPGGIVWRHEGGSFFTMERLGISMDPGGEDGYDGERSAQIGLQISACNPGSAGIRLPELRQIGIRGSRDRPRPGSVGLHLTGCTNNDQLDSTDFNQLSINRVERAILQDSLMALIVQVRNSKLKATRAAVDLRMGSMSLIDTQLNCQDEGDCVYVDIGYQASYFRMIRSYAEVQDYPAVIRIGANATHRNHAYRSHVLVDGSRFNLQCDSSRDLCEVRLLDVRALAGRVTVRDSNFTAAGGPGSADQRRFTIHAETHEQNQLARIRLDELALRVTSANTYRPRAFRVEHLDDWIDFEATDTPMLSWWAEWIGEDDD